MKKNLKGAMVVLLPFVVLIAVQAVGYAKQGELGAYLLALLATLMFLGFTLLCVFFGLSIIFKEDK